MSFSDHLQNVSVVCRSRRHKLSHFYISLKGNWQKASLGKEIQVSSEKGSRPLFEFDTVMLIIASVSDVALRPNVKSAW